MTVSLPEAFIRNIRQDIPGAADALFSVLDGTPPVSVRWNPYKTQSPAEGIPVAWCRYGRYLPERPSFTTDPLFHAGAYYVQEASSMFVEHLLRSTTEPEGARILDLCAAPGGKATLYSTLAGGDGIVIANEVIRSRALILADNIRKWGIGNTMVTNNDPAHFAGLGEWFDESLNVCEEADVFYRIAKTWELDHVDEPLTRWRVHGVNTTFRKFGQFADETLRILDKHRKLYPGYDRDYPDLVGILTRRAAFQKAVTLWREGNGAEARRLVAPYVASPKLRLFWLASWLPGSLFDPLSQLYFKLPGFLRK